MTNGEVRMSHLGLQGLQQQRGGGAKKVVQSKIDLIPGGESTVRHWYDEGFTYAEMVKKALDEHHVQISPTAISNLARRRGWPRRSARDDELIPWAIKAEHQDRRQVVMLRLIARQRAGLPIREREESELKFFLTQIKSADAVVHYDPATEDGFFYVPRQEGDAEFIRPPKRGLTKRHAR